MEPFLYVVRIEMFVYSLKESLPFETVLWLRHTVEGASLIIMVGVRLLFMLTILNIGIECIL
jgi:hypothetical protein